MFTGYRLSLSQTDEIWPSWELNRLRHTWLPRPVKTLERVQPCPDVLRHLIPMSAPIILASGSAIRAQMLENASVPFEVIQPRVDEDAIKQSLLEEEASPRNIADALAELKARKVSEKRPHAFVIGSDQVLDFQGRLLSKPETPEQAFDHLVEMRGKGHCLYSAVVICESGRPIWRHVGRVRLQMRTLSDAYLRDYISRNWTSIRHSVGAYKLEEEGVRLFSAIDGDYFSVLGMPLTDLLNFLALRGAIET